MSRPTISLLTDFGSQSAYVGILKGVIWNINPEANIVDLGHEVTPHNIREAAFLLETSYRYLPRRAIHVVIVDPGVGSVRRPILAVGERASYIGPDNGVFSYVLDSDSVATVYELMEEHFWLRPVSSTFHGRDIFAPCAAWLSTGTDMDRFGEKIDDPVRLDVTGLLKVQGNQLVGQVQHVDRFGNLVTNINRTLLAHILKQVLQKFDRGGFRVHVGESIVEPYIRHYAEIEPGAVASILGSSDHLEIIVREGSAAHKCNAKPGTEVVVKFCQFPDHDAGLKTRLLDLIQKNV